MLHVPGDLINDYRLPVRVLESVSAGCRRALLRLSFCANLLLSRLFSPGFRKKECCLTSLIMPSCWTCRLKRRRALSMDSPSKIRTSAKMCLRGVSGRAVSMSAWRAESNASFLRCPWRSDYLPERNSSLRTQILRLTLLPRPDGLVPKCRRRR